MRLASRMRSWLRSVVQRSRMERDMNDEIHFHLEAHIIDLVQSGVSEQEARRLARAAFGSVDARKEECREAVGLRVVDELTTDVRYAVRQLRRSPGFTSVAVISLALGIGANTTIFSLLNAVMLQVLPVDEPGELVRIARIRENGRPALVAYPAFEQFRDNMRSVSGLFAQTTSSRSIVIEGEDDFVTADAVSGAYFAVLRLEPSAGRLLGPADDVVSPTSPAAVITDRYWQRRFGRSLSAIGTSLTIGERVFTVVGVTPPGFQGAQAGRASDLILPLLTMLPEEQRASLGFNTLAVLDRLKLKFPQDSKGIIPCFNEIRQSLLAGAAYAVMVFSRV